jgi:2-polyprenyl-3-methyl-5-hydroxy-6-metoxy-1,4-benzoquinol methylase
MTETISNKPKTDFEQQYLAIRQKEGRIHSDTTVSKLPDVAREHPHYAEWQIRKESCRRLKQHFEKKLSLIKILEVGCGNGWLCHQLAYIPGCDVTGTDINFAELQQAFRVFSHIPNLKFIYGGINAEEIKEEQYDYIVFASSIQYFPSVSTIISEVMQNLRPGGEIHILDSPFYKQEEITVAQKRTEEHYKAIGLPEMAAWYFHHTLNDLQPFSYNTLYAPSFVNRHILNNKNPFPWIYIKKQ